MCSVGMTMVHTLRRSQSRLHRVPWKANRCCIVCSETLIICCSMRPENVCCAWLVFQVPQEPRFLPRTVPSMQVPDLVGGRRAFVAKGHAYVPSDQLCSVVAGLFRAALSKSLVMTAGRWATTIAGDEAQRLAPVIRSLATRCGFSACHCAAQTCR